MNARARAALVCTALASTVLAACGGDLGGNQPVEPYGRTPVPAVPARTEPVGDALGSGAYWADAVGAVPAAADGTGGSIDFVVTQAFFGPECVAALGEDACPDEVGVLDDPSLEVTVPLTDLRSASVAAETRQNLAVDAAELASLVSGAVPGEGAPLTYAYTPYPFLLTVRDGIVVEARQIWMP